MALMNRVGQGFERLRHINIRDFWVAEKLAYEDVVIEHLNIDFMLNVLTEHVQVAQFERERAGITNWV